MTGKQISFAFAFDDGCSPDKGAYFSDCRQYRYALWRIWNWDLPTVMFIGLNPSTANETENDPTIKSVERIARYNGYGGFYMMNCFAYVSTDPNALRFEKKYLENRQLLREVRGKCKDVVFAWGNFEIVHELGVDLLMKGMFPDALCLQQNKNGSPKHPLYCSSHTILKKYIWPDAHPQSN